MGTLMLTVLADCTVMLPVPVMPAALDAMLASVKALAREMIKFPLSVTAPDPKVPDAVLRLPTCIVLPLLMVVVPA